MVLDLMLGGDLRFHLDRLGPLREEQVRFYIAELALALEDLHGRGIVHRLVQVSGFQLWSRGPWAQGADGTFVMGFAGISNLIIYCSTRRDMPT